MLLENTRRIAKNTVMLYIRMLLIMGVTLYTSRVVLQVLGVEDYGIYNVVGGIVVMFSFLNGAMSQSTQRFLAYEIGRNDFQQLQKVFSLSIIIHIGIALCIFLLAEIFGIWFLNTQMNIPESRLDAAHWIFQFSIFSFMISVVQVPYNAAIIAYERMQAYAYISVLEVLMKLFIVFILTWIDFDKLKLYAVLVFGVTTIVAFFYRLYCMVKLPSCKYVFFWNKKLFREITGFAGWNLMGNIAWLAKSQGCNILLNIFLGPLVNTAYGLANQVNAAVTSFVQNFSTALNPQIVKSYASGDIPYMSGLFFKGVKFSYYLLLLFVLPLCIETEFVLKIWLKEVPEYAVVFTRLVLLNSLLEAFSPTFAAVIQATGRVKWYQIIIGCTILLNLPLSWLFLKLHFSPIVVFVISILISMIAFLERIWIVWYYIHFSLYQFFSKVGLRIMLTTVVASIMPLICFIYFSDGWVRFIAVLGICLISVCMTIFFVGLEWSERRYLWNLLKQYIKALPTK